MCSLVLFVILKGNAESTLTQKMYAVRTGADCVQFNCRKRFLRISIAQKILIFNKGYMT